MKCDYDIAFAGAGLAAVSLAVRLIQLPNPPKIVMVDPRTSVERDRTWCHWQLRENPFTPAISHRWNRWNVSSGHKSAAGYCAAHPYVRLTADRVHRMAEDQLLASPHVVMHRGPSVTALDNFPGHTQLALSDGKKITAAWTFDSRPLTNKHAAWRQVFRGLEIHSPEAELDDQAVTLMDFQSAGPEGIRFFYVLPMDKQTALVEDTWLVPDGQSPDLSDEKIMAYAAEKLGPTGWQIRHREEGDLPMGLARASKAESRIILWGTPGGAVRASSGYAFSRIQRASEHMAAAWQKNGRPEKGARHESPLIGWMDRVFLRVMQNHPGRVPDFFLQLIQNVPSGSLVRFLESEPRPTDILRVMRALPTAPFLAAALP